jgi:ACS family tartrate transporter-like MFS transporter
MAALILGAAGLALSVSFFSLIPALSCLTLALIGTISARTVFYTVPQGFLTGAAAAGGHRFYQIRSVRSAVSWGLTWLVVLKDTTGSFDAGMLGMSGILILATLLAWSLKLVIRDA